MNDLRFALRQIAKSPGYSAVVILTLAFGIAVNTTIYSMVSVFFLRPPPVPEPERLVLLLQRSEHWKMPHGISYPDFRDYRERLRTVGDLFAFLPQAAHLRVEGGVAQRAWIEAVTPNSFTALAVPAHLGRVLVPADGERPGGAPVAVLSHACWKDRFGGDPLVLGRTIRLNGQGFTVVGVAAPDFHGFSSAIASSAFVTTGAMAQLRANGGELLEQRGAPAWRVMGRLAAGASLADARAEVAVVSAQFAREYPESHRSVRALVLPERLARPDPLFADFLPVFAALFGGLVLLVLFIACANVANLMFARALARQHEFTVRAALGAGRGRLIRQLLVESLVLAAAAGVVGWTLASWTGPLLARFAPATDIPIVAPPGPGWHEYAFTALISIAAGLASGLLPALRASRFDVVQRLKDAGGARVAGGRHAARNLLVVMQVTFSLVLLIGAGLFVRSLHRVRTVDIGFRSENLLLVSFDLGLHGYSADRGDVFHRELLQRARALPGVVGAALTTNVPFDYGVRGSSVWPENAPAGMTGGNLQATTTVVSAGCAELLGHRLRSGRFLDEADRGNRPRVAVINATLAQLCWPGQEAVGKRFRTWRDGEWHEVVGVTDTAKYVMVAEPPRPFFYTALAQDFSAPLTLLVRTTGEPASVVAAVRETFRSLDANLPVYNVRTMDDLIESSVFGFMPLRMGATLAGAQGAIGLLLSVMGLYAVVSFGVAQRTREIGIRIALGADSAKVMRLVLREGVRLSAVGLALGIVLGGGVGLAMSKVLYGISPFDPVIVGLGILVLAGTTLLACYLPARRATRVSPVDALRAE